VKTYLPRRIEATLRRCAEQFPCVVLTGPRQSGKTTLVRHTLGNSHAYVSLDEPDVRAGAIEDPRLFLASHPPPLIIDEIQYAPELLAYIKSAIDKDRERAGQFVLTGSQVFPLMHGVGESLAGRTAVLTLLPLSWGEKTRTVADSSPVAPDAVHPQGRLDAQTVFAGIVRGSFPEPWVKPERDIRHWYAGYVQTYLERDVRQLRHVGDLEEFQRFLRVLAARNGQLLNMAELGRDLGLALNTVKAWISVLVASHQVMLLRPYFRNMGKRLVKSPKVYFLDSGLVCYLTGVRTPEQCLDGPSAGGLFEATVVSEIAKWFCNRGEQPALYAWRTAAGHEVDCIAEHEGGVWPIEVKKAATVKPEAAKSLAEFLRLFPEAARARLVYLGEGVLRLTEKVEAVPFAWMAHW
jgi:predicted AAA+ superfamily ATPase